MSEAGQSSYQAGLTFIDLLYAVPVADLATRVSKTDLHMSVAGWADVLLALIAITFGWIGHHTNRQKMPRAMADHRLEPESPFAGAYFLQFAVEVGIIGAYFALGIRANLHHVVAATELWKATWLLAVFALYFTWDLLDVHIAIKLRNACDSEAQRLRYAEATRERLASKALNSWAEQAKAGRAVTFGFLLVFSAFLVVALTGPRVVIAFDIVAIGSLYLYRRVQQFARNEVT